MRVLPSPRTSPSSARTRAGLSLVEVTLALAIVTVASGFFARTMVSSRRLDPLSTESSIAASAARVVIERMRAEPVGDVVELFNADTADDPLGSGTAPGNRFAVADLSPFEVGSEVGRIEFPTIDGHVREDSKDALLGMPRDLNGDGLIDSLDHDQDWILLPVRVRLGWSSRGTGSRERTFQLYTMLCRL